MCEYGDTVKVSVRIPADLSCTGKARWKVAEVDRCIAPIVAALQAGNINMRSSCCGHRKADGYIELQDRRCLVLRSKAEGGVMRELRVKEATNGWILEDVSEGQMFVYGDLEIEELTFRIKEIMESVQGRRRENDPDDSDPQED